MGKTQLLGIIAADDERILNISTVFACILSLIFPRAEIHGIGIAPLT
jgi:hypothetical protein